MHLLLVDHSNIDVVYVSSISRIFHGLANSVWQPSLPRSIRRPNTMASLGSTRRRTNSFLTEDYQGIRVERTYTCIGAYCRESRTVVTDQTGIPLACLDANPIQPTRPADMMDPCSLHLICLSPAGCICHIEWFSLQPLVPTQGTKEGHLPGRRALRKTIRIARLIPGYALLAWIHGQAVHACKNRQSRRCNAALTAAKRTAVLVRGSFFHSTHGAL